MERDFLIEAYYAKEHDENESLTHHGIKGQQWGIRRYQNMDGSLTPEGRRHWGIGDAIRGAKTNVQKYVKSKKAAALRKKKSEILARGDVDEILEKKKLFTTNELDKAIGRSQRISMLKAMTPEQQKAREKAIKDQEKAARGKEAVDRGLYRAGQLVQMAPAMIQCYAIIRGLLGHGGGSSPNVSQIVNAATNAASAAANQNNTNSSNHQPATVDQAISTATYNNNKYKIKPNNQAVIYSTSTEGIDTTSLPSWSNPTTNAIFTDCMHTAETVPINSLANSTLFSDNAGASMYGPAGAASDSSYNLDFD
jgi:hypothetical protein